MKYLCLGYYDEKKFEALPRDQVDALVSKCRTHDEALRQSGHLLCVASLGESVGWGVEVRPIDYFDEPKTQEKKR